MRTDREAEMGFPRHPRIHSLTMADLLARTPSPVPEAAETVSLGASIGAVQAAPQQDIFTGLALMNEHRLDHLPVVEDGRLCGLVSRNDLQAAVIGQYERIFHELELDLKILFLQGTYSC